MDKIPIYKTIDTLPIINWHLLLKSQREGNIELRYLLKIDVDEDLPEYDVTELIPIYDKITDEIPNLDLSLSQKAILYSLEYSKYSLQMEKYQLSILLGKNQQLPSDVALNKSFANYIAELQLTFNAFVFKQYSIVADLREKYHDTYVGVTYMFEKLEGASWFHFDQFERLINIECPELKSIIYNPTFFEKFIEEKDIRFSNLTELDRPLSGIYKTLNDYEAYQKIRFELFNIESITGEKQDVKETTIFDEIVELNRITGYKLDARHSTVSDLIAVRNLAKKIISEHEKNKR